MRNMAATQRLPLGRETTPVRAPATFRSRSDLQPIETNRISGQDLIVQAYIVSAREVHRGRFQNIGVYGATKSNRGLHGLAASGIEDKVGSKALRQGSRKLLATPLKFQYLSHDITP